jgi:hypothetical protein
VSSVFDAIDQEVAPLQSLLPQAPAQGGDGKRQGSGSVSGGSSGDHRSTAPSSSGTTPSSGRHARPGDPSGSATGSSGEGLLGGDTGGLLDPPKTGTGTSAPSAGKSPSAAPDVTLPPLLPGLLPGLGIDSEDTH